MVALHVGPLVGGAVVAPSCMNEPFINSGFPGPCVETPYPGKVATLVRPGLGDFYYLF